MSSKAVLRLLIGCVISALLLVWLLPVIGVPKSYLLPPSVELGTAKGKTTAYVTTKKTGGSINPFNSGETMYYITYQFRATPPENLIEKPTPDEKKKKKVYHGHVNVTEATYHSFRNPETKDDPANDKKSETMPVRFEKTRPDINAALVDGTRMNDEGGSVFFGSWMLFVAGILLLGYIIAPFLQRIFLREDY